MRAGPVRLALVLSAGLIVGGCGQLGASWKGTRLEQPAVIAPAEVQRYPADAPQRSFLAWFRALQLDDTATAAGFYDKALGLSPKRVARSRRRARRLLREAGLEVVDVSRGGRRATVFTLLTVRRVAPNGRVDAYVTPQAFDLVRVGGAWKLANNLFLQSADSLHRDLAIRVARLSGA